LKRIGDILDLPRAPLAARFGADLLRMLDPRARREHEPLTPRLPVAPYSPKRIFTSRSRAKRTCSRPSSGSRCGSRRRWRRAETARRDLSLPLPHRRRGQAHRRRHLAPVRDPQAIRALSSSGSPRSATRSIRASASIWRGSPCSPPNLSGRADRSRRHEDQAELDRLSTA
jgi:hypothetical protein